MWPKIERENWFSLNFLIFSRTYEKIIEMAFVFLQKRNNFPKFGEYGSKIGPATPI